MFGVGVFLLISGCASLLLSLNRLGGKVEEMDPADRARRGGPPGATVARESARQFRLLIAIGVAGVVTGGLLMILG
jgi:hypothetical protein